MKHDTRHYWVETLLKLAGPVFEALSRDELRERMPVEAHPQATDRERYSHLEAVGRSLAGIGPWLALDEGISPEEDQRRRGLLDLVQQSLTHATDPKSRDFLNFTEGSQPVVDAAFLALGLLRSWEHVWLKLPVPTQEALVRCMMSTRAIKPYFNNWLLFSATVECFLCKAGREWDRVRVDYAIRQHEQWYKGDGAYGDGPHFHWDYYNSFVIHPMLYEIVHVDGEPGILWSDYRDRIIARAQRHAEIQERMIAPDGSFPAMGRSLTYRFGAFHLLALMALRGCLPSSLSVASVRCALTAAMKRTLCADGTFDTNGWLQIGLCGHQPSLGEHYISTGSLYLALCGFLPLGLPESDCFWSEGESGWSASRLWNGEDLVCDHALRD